jgi:F5/8 type C domain
MMKIKRNFLYYFVSFCLIFLFVWPFSLNVFSLQRNRSDWLHSSGWGIFVHFLSPPNTTSDKWNTIVNNFDENFLAHQLKLTGTKYFFITLGQNSGYYCAPNSNYDKFTESKLSKCSKRDLISDLYKVLKPLKIKLLLYLPSAAPSDDSYAVSKLNWKSGPYRNLDFQRKWESVIKEWSLRWGNKVTGWWFDGAKWPNEMYKFSTPPNFESFAAAARAGNPSSILAFNPGEPIINQTPFEDYTGGEINDPWSADCNGRFIGKAQYHLLSYLGSTWGTGPKRFSDHEVIRITQNVNKCGGVITWDVPILSNGHIPQKYIDQLIALKHGLHQPRARLYPAANIASGKVSKLLDLNGTKELSVNSAKYFPRLGVDGIPSSFAMAGGEWAWTYHVDLSELHMIKKVVVQFGPYFATEYKVNISSDGIKWLTVANKSNSRTKKITHQFPPIKARYIRIQGIKPDGPNQVGRAMSISELEVY